ncbi:DsbA family oxidoreductase (plasmid) [Streptomyces sp. NBC_01471]|uniref:DsbA family oxidoreductase n=1 Tax=Streptomyces sp. NBC_01471 TaxID=2903879 RepID=UPI002F9070D4
MGNNENTTATTRRVELVLDIICLHSHIGYARFARAAERFRADGGRLDVVFRPFQVNPTAAEAGEPLLDVLRRQFGPGFGQDTEGLAAMGAADGVELNYDRAVYSNTFQAHRLIAQASAQGLGEPMVERLFRAYATEGLNVGDPATLDTLAAEVGVVLRDGGDDALRADLEEVRSQGISSVPYFVFDGRTAFSGSQPEETYLAALKGSTADVG